MTDHATDPSATPSQLLAVALDHAARGWPVFPLVPGGKRPALHAVERCPRTGACAGGHRRSGPRLVAFFGLLYFAGLRPEEAANVRRADLTLPVQGWGEAHLQEATPDAGTAWTNDGAQRDRRQLKNRARGESRTVPCPPELTRLLREHVTAFPPGPDGRLFPGERADELPKLTYMRAWRAARAMAFTPEVAAGPLGRTPYDLRHACVSTWLNGGVPAPQVAVWAGHSVEVLLKVYAKCLDGQDAVARQRVEEALGYGPA